MSRSTDIEAIVSAGSSEVIATHAIPLAVLMEDLRTSAATGLSSEEAHRRMECFGPNRIEEVRSSPRWLRFLRQFNEVVVWILIAAAILSGLIGDWPDTLAILAIVLLNCLLGFFQEERAERSLSALRSLAAPRARVLRDGELQEVSASELVPGDVIVLESGDRVSADARLLEAFHLSLEQASLTGESIPVSKDAEALPPRETALADRENMIWSGTVAVTGKARAVVTSTGMRTEIGRIADLLQRDTTEATPLQKRLGRLGKVLIVVCLALVAVFFTLQILRGGDFREVLLLSVSLAVAAVPEGLPAVVTIALALGLQRMVRRHALVRRLPSVETLGSVSVVCSDKTGTLTRNEMTVRAVVAGGSSWEVSGSGYSPHGEFRLVSPSQEGEREIDADLHEVLRIGALCNDACLRDSTDGRKALTVVGDPTEGALLVAARKAGVSEDRSSVRVLGELPFDSERKTMSVLIEESPGRVRLLTKGAVETVLACSDFELMAGKAEPLSEDRRSDLLAQAGSLASCALRVLGFASREFDSTGESRLEEKGLVFAGFVGMIDPPREEVREAVRKCRNAGIRPILITGDHPGTAQAVALELEILQAQDRLVTGPELDALSDEQLVQEIESISAYARVTPEDKLRIVRAWRGRGHVVAMTGDGVNDAPAVQEADIGIAMGLTGTDVTREAADMVLMDDNFASIVAAVEEGRGIFENIQKFVHFLLASNAGEVLLMLFAAVIGWPAPLLAIQILWINLVTDGLPALALAMEPPERGILERTPRRVDDSVIGWRRSLVMVLHGSLMAGVGSIGFALAYGDSPAELSRARTVAFTTVALSQILYAFACRSPRWTVLQLGLWTNPFLWGAVGVSVLLQLTVVSLPLVQSTFQVSPLSWADWALVGCLALVPVATVESAKMVSAGLRARRTRSEADGSV